MAEKAAMNKSLTVEVVYGTPERQWLLRCTVPAGATVLEAVHASGLHEEVPTLQGQELVLGVFGQRMKDYAAYTLKEGDRIEVYRPLIIDPKQARRERAKQKRSS